MTRHNPNGRYCREALRLSERQRLKRMQQWDCIGEVRLLVGGSLNAELRLLLLDSINCDSTCFGCWHVGLTAAVCCPRCLVGVSAQTAPRSRLPRSPALFVHSCGEPVCINEETEPRPSPLS